MTMKTVSLVLFVGTVAVLCALLSGCQSLDPSFTANPDGSTTVSVPTRVGTVHYIINRGPSK